MSDRPERSVQDLSAGIAIAIAGRGRSSALRAGLEAGPGGRAANLDGTKWLSKGAVGTEVR